MTKKLFTLALAISTILFFSACEKDDPVIPNEEELITTLNYTLTSQDGTEVVTLTFQDLDGDGGNAPTVSEGVLSTNQSYTGRLELLNEAESPAENITTEIQEEDEEHQFFFQSTVSNLAIAYDDEDADGNPVGLSSMLTTGDAATGNITITLIHEPEKTATGVATGDISNAAGEIDIEVTFPISVQ